MKNKDLDKMLNHLGDFDPLAKPDWEAFIAENETRINPAGKTPVMNAGKKAFINSGLRYAAIVAVASLGLLIAWYFAGTPLDSAQPVKVQESEETVTEKDLPLQAESVPESNPEGFESQPEQLIISDRPEVNQPHQIQTLDFELAIEPEVLDIQDEPVHFNMQEPDQHNTIIIKDTVFVKKKVYVTDTIRK